MGWIEPVSTAIAAAGIVNDLAKASRSIKRHANRIVYRIRSGTIDLPIFGCGGAGKSTAAKVLVGEDPLNITAAYDESWMVEALKLKGDIPGQILAAPGQKERVDRHWPDLIKSIISGKSVGIINVVSYGLHSFNLNSISHHNLYEKNMSNSEFLFAYSNNRRETEIEFLNKLLHGLIAASNKFWMITLVNKQDLWWDRRDEVHRHYNNGQYRDIIEEFTNKKGSINFQHEFIPVCLTMNNLSTLDGNEICKTASGYSFPLFIKYLHSFLERTHTMVEKSR